MIDSAGFVKVTSDSFQMFLILVPQLILGVLFPFQPFFRRCDAYCSPRLQHRPLRPQIISTNL